YAEWNIGTPFNRMPFEYLLKNSVAVSQVLNSNLGLSYRITKNLTASASVQYSSAQNENDYSSPLAATDPRNSGMALTSLGNTRSNTVGFEGQIQHRKTWNDLHVNWFIGGNYQNSRTRIEDVMGLGYSSDDLLKSIYNAMMVINNDI